MKAVRFAQITVGAALIATKSYAVFVGPLSWTVYTPSSTQVIKQPVWPVAVALAVVLFLLVIWEAAGRKRTRR